MQQPEIPHRTRSRLHGLSAAALAALATALALPALAQAASFPVTLTSDSGGTCQPAGPCTLRQAIASAHDGDTVTLAAGSYPLTAAAGGTIAIDHSIVIAGPVGKAAETVIDGGGMGSRIFSIPGGQTVAFADVTLAHGRAGEGGGAAILAENAGTIDLTRVAFDHNSTSADGGALRELDGTVSLTDVSFTANSARLGGALDAYSGAVTGTGVLFDGNEASGAGGAVYADSANVALTNASLAANTAVDAGGALYSADSGVSLINDTFASDNTAAESPGGADVFDEAAGTTTAVNTIFGPTAAGVACAGGELGLMSHDIEGDSSCSAPATPAVEANTDARLMALGDYTGPTPTVGIEPSSPAVDAAEQAACPARDERGVSRAGGCDIGAFQRQPGDPSPPYAHTDAASAVSDTSATLDATVNPSGQPTSYRFEYWASGGPVETTTPLSLASTWIDHSVSAPVGSLLPATEYEYRVLATNADGTSVALSRTFTTPANQLPACTSASVSVLAGGSVTLPLSCVDPDGETVTRAITSGPAHGTVGSIDQAAGTVAYTASSGYSGADSVSFDAADSLGAHGPSASVAIDVKPAEAGGGEGGPTQPAPGCHTAVSFGIIEAHGCFDHVGDEYRTAVTATVNGLTITPLAGGTLVLDSSTGKISSSSGAARVAIGPFVLTEGPLDWLAPAVEPPGGAQVAQFDPNHRIMIEGFPVAGHVTMTLVRGATDVELALRLPDVFNGLTGQTTLHTSEAHGFSLSSLSLAADDLELGPVRLDNVLLSYSADTDTWQGGATVYLPTPYKLGIIGGLSLQHGRFQSATAGVDDLNVPLADGFYLQRVQLSLAVDPLDIGGGISVSVGPVLPLTAPTGTTTAPKPGEEMVRIDGNFDWRFSNPWRLHVDGAVKLIDANLASAYFDYLSSGSMDFGGKIEYGLPNPAEPDHQPVYFAATLNGWVDGSRAFDAEAAAILRVEGADVAGVQLLVSNVGIAGCGQIGWLYGGFGYRWVDRSLAVLGPWACDVGPYRPAPPAAAAAGVRGLRFGPRAGTEIVKAIGASSSPQLTLEGPGGQRVSTRADGEPIVNGGFVVLTDRTSNTTYVAIRHAAGRWRMTVAQGSVIRELLTAATLPRPRVGASVLGRGRARALRYTIDAQPGERVQFVEEGAQTHRVIGSVGPGRGVLRFVPGDGPAGRRRIAAIVLRDGLPESERVVASYTAPAPLRPLKPTRVEVGRRGRTVLVAWRAAPGSVEGYAVHVTVAGGARRLLFVPAGRTRLAVRGLLASDSAVITVAGVGPDGTLGPAARALLLPVRRR